MRILFKQAALLGRSVGVTVVREDAIGQVTLLYFVVTLRADNLLAFA